jgi:hypothetical protein
MYQHDAQPGPLQHCQISGGALFPIIDLGYQPLCDSLLSSLDAPETHYPLTLNMCAGSGLAQLSHVVDGAQVYAPSYPYRSSVSKVLVEYQQQFADGVLRRYPDARGGLVVDIGSNDGTLLQGFQRAGCRVLGVEPTNVAQLAQVPTWQEFFCEAVGHAVARLHGRAAVVTMTNVFAHMSNLGSVMRGVCAMLDTHGVLVVENHYLLDVREKLQFDTIYHEHIRTYSLRALRALFDQYDMEIIGAERATRYGGNIRVYVARRGAYGFTRAGVEGMLAHEEDAGLFSQSRWRRWAQDVRGLKQSTMELLYSLRSQGRRIVGCSAPGRGATLLNYYGIGPDMVEYLAEPANSLKIGKYMPGCHIPVVDNRRLPQEQPDYVLLLAWHYADAIIARLRFEGVRSKVIVPLPTLRIVET